MALSNTTFELYSTDGCHLCEIAVQLVAQLNKMDQVQVIDIVDDEQLVAKYGTIIPVLRCQSTAKEINWPFDLEQLSEFMT